MPRRHSPSRRLREPTSTYSAEAPAAAAEHRRHAKLFMNGRSQAVRLPREFRMPGSEVRIRREGELVILEPIAPREWPPGYFESWTASGIERHQPAMPPPRRLDG
jgi:antitoxin VapB